VKEEVGAVEKEKITKVKKDVDVKNAGEER